MVPTKPSRRALPLHDVWPDSRATDEREITQSGWVVVPTCSGWRYPHALWLWRPELLNLCTEETKFASAMATCRRFGFESISMFGGHKLRPRFASPLIVGDQSNGCSPDAFLVGLTAQQVHCKTRPLSVLTVSPSGRPGWSAEGG